MTNHIENYKNFVIYSTEGVQTGLFLRTPIQTRTIVLYNDSYLEKYLKAINNPFRKFYERLIGNGRIIKDIDNILDDIDCYGFDIRVLCFPIHFKRNYRRLTAVSTNKENNIVKINSYGYETPFNTCAGECYIEHTVIKLRNNKMIRIKQTKEYNYTYSHIIKKIIDTGEIK